MYPLVIVSNSFNKPFVDFTNKEAKAYFEWFMNIKEERIGILEKNVQQYNKDWYANFSRLSFTNLFVWFKSNVKSKKTNETEAEEIRNQLLATPFLVNVIEISDTSFTKETVSICFDVAIYFGETLIRNISDLSWIYKVNSKRYVEYAQPIIINPFKKIDVNPRRLIEVCAEKIIDGTNTENEFKDLYAVWDDMFKS
jgi:hypothetical protein